MTTGSLYFPPLSGAFAIGTSQFTVTPNYLYNNLMGFTSSIGVKATGSAPTVDPPVVITQGQLWPRGNF